LRKRGLPSCRQYPQRKCPTGAALVAPACAGGEALSSVGRSYVVANWFYLYLQKPSFVLDLAAGCRGLRGSLPPGIRYLAAHEFTPACNYNDGLIPKLPGKVAQEMSGVVSALGVLEQVCDVPSFLEALKTYYRPLVVSYSPVDSKDVDVKGRVNAYTTAQWRAVLHKLNLDQPHHEARVFLNGEVHLLYWFEPVDWTPFAA